jgi:parvulin-like peptidyl-prolyl isomerase
MAHDRAAGSITPFIVGALLLITVAGLVYAFVPRPEPQRVTVQHILIASAGTRTTATRSREAAEKLAGEIFKRAESGEDFGWLVKTYSDDPVAPGIYSMCNAGVTRQAEEYDRKSIVPAFGNLGFKLKVGRIGMAPYDPQASPFGWHIIKRLK